MSTEEHPLIRLAVADPSIAADVEQVLTDCPVDEHALDILLYETLWALSHELTFGKAVALGHARLLAMGCQAQIPVYQSVVRKAGNIGPTYGKILAIHLVPVLICQDQQLLERFKTACQIMRSKGTYTLKKPLEGLANLLEEGDVLGGLEFINLLIHAYDREMGYNQSLQLTRTLPKAVAAMSKRKRVWQIAALSRIIETDISAAECFISGLQRGLALLHEKGLKRFVSLGLAKYGKNRSTGCRFLSLESKFSQDTSNALQVSQPLPQIQADLIRYVRTRIGRRIKIQSSDGFKKSVIWGKEAVVNVFSDQNCIYLPEEMNVYGTKQKNANRYLDLVKLESAHLEFGTYDFDADRTLEISGLDLLTWDPTGKAETLFWKQYHSEIERFIHLFDNPQLAVHLFVIYEHGRIRSCLNQHYPGIIRRVYPAMQIEMLRILRRDDTCRLLNILYALIALDLPSQKLDCNSVQANSIVAQVRDLVRNEFNTGTAPETTGKLLLWTYRNIQEALLDSTYQHKRPRDCLLMETPFQRGLKPDLVFTLKPELHDMAALIQSKLRQNHLKVSRFDLYKKLLNSQTPPTPQKMEDLIEILLDKAETLGWKKQSKPLDLSFVDLTSICDAEFDAGNNPNRRSANMFTYPEWDDRLGDYLTDHVRVFDRKIEGQTGSFYPETLERFHGLVQKMRQAFELLKPAGISMLRQWVEGDQFDYRALLEFCVDRKMGRVPSDRLYIKRDKKQRDVAVLILVDLSKSTDNLVNGTESRVLDIEKEALVLLSEALVVAGDQFAVAGFSGSGRSGVDYLRIKDFAENLDENVQMCIQAMVPMRSTRMGAAIRHATHELEKIPAKVRVLLVLSDGFPNDVGYKQGYAVADTRRAVFEAHAKQIHFRAIVVNMAGDLDLDALYGNFQHSLISDIRELPDKLLNIYSTMTRI